MPIAVEVHWSLIDERYHDPLRRIANKLAVDSSFVPLPHLRNSTNMVLPHTIGSEGFTPAILAFGSQLRLPIGEYLRSPRNVVNRMDLITTARRDSELVVLLTTYTARQEYCYPD